MASQPDAEKDMPPASPPAAKAAAEEQALIAAAKSGDVAAYGRLVALHQSHVLRTARYLGAADGAQDAAQEAFVVAWRSLAKFETGRPFRPWILRIVTNEVRSKQRNLRRRTAILDLRGSWLLPEAPEQADAAALGEECRRLLVHALARLPERQRLAVIYRHLLELSENETAEALGWPAGTVKSRLSRALARLRDDPTLAALLERQP